MAKTHYEDRKLSFDTLAIHVGQEKPDPATGAILIMPRRDSG